MINLTSDGQSGLPGHIDVSEVELPVEIQEDGVITHIGSDVLSLGPGRGLEILVRQFGEAVLVQVVDLVHVTLLDHVLEVLEELLDLVGNHIVQPVLHRVQLGPYLVQAPVRVRASI